MQYKTKLDDLHKAITFIVFVAMIIPSVNIATTAINGHPENWLILVGLVLILAASYWFRPIGYSLNGKELRVHRPAGDKVFTISETAPAQIMEKKELGFGLRTILISGIFGSYGQFYYQKLGMARSYITDYSQLVLLTTQDGEKLLITPDSREAFLKELYPKTKRSGR